MENQHRHIKGYRELTQEDIDLMNDIKEAGARLLELQKKLEDKLFVDEVNKGVACNYGSSGTPEEKLEYERFCVAEPKRWAAIGKTDIQTGIMALVRAVAQPAI